jgi:hypothetical protein
MSDELPEILALEEDLLVANDAVVLETGQDAHLIQGIFDLFLGKVRQFHFLQRVDLLVCDSLDLEDR